MFDRIQPRDVKLQAAASCLISSDQQRQKHRSFRSIDSQLKMSYEVCGDPGWSVRYSKGDEEREERLVNIYDSLGPAVGCRAAASAQDGGTQGSRGGVWWWGPWNRTCDLSLLPLPQRAPRNLQLSTQSRTELPCWSSACWESCCWSASPC